MSDNGGVSKFWKGGLRGNKAGVHEGGVRSPFYARWPGTIPAGSKVEAQTSHVDLLPTFCELAEAPVPKDRQLDGRSFASLLKTGQGKQREETGKEHKKKGTYHDRERVNDWGSTKRPVVVLNAGRWVGGRVLETNSFARRGQVSG